MTTKERYKKVLSYFKANNPNASSELDYTSPYELLVAVILSAQCTDKRVNQITPILFKRFPTVEAMAESCAEEIFEYIKTCSYPNNKAKHLHGMAVKLVAEFESTVPSNDKELESLPGVGRKTANVIASVIFNKPRMAVDTHVFRVSARIGLTTNAKTPLEAENQLIKHIPESDIPTAHHWLILHGRYVCTAKKPKCESCPITSYCLHYELNKNSIKKI
ncbi:MAG: endonuclease III [Bacteroidales bacterium]|nr:endonuclease III [Bacteroidales bacterium]